VPLRSELRGLSGTSNLNGVGFAGPATVFNGPLAAERAAYELCAHVDLVVGQSERLSQVSLHALHVALEGVRTILGPARALRPLKKISGRPRLISTLYMSWVPRHRSTT
jgi:hypothetical protein